jgi:hypothetical protein
MEEAGSREFKLSDKGQNNMKAGSGRAAPTRPKINCNRRTRNLPELRFSRICRDAT